MGILWEVTPEIGTQLLSICVTTSATYILLYKLKDMWLGGGFWFCSMKTSSGWDLKANGFTSFLPLYNSM